MPVTAKFSRDFYDRVGHEAVDELVDFLNRIDAGYRSELLELNDRNFARFDDRLERRLAEFQGRIEQRTAGLEVRLNRRIDELDVRLEQRTAELRADLKSGLATMESRLVRWMFLFVATGVLTILGLG